jgi:hypothetical protein
VSAHITALIGAREGSRGDPAQGLKPPNISPQSKGYLLTDRKANRIRFRHEPASCRIAAAQQNDKSVTESTLANLAGT